MLAILLAIAYGAIYRALGGPFSDRRYRVLVASVAWGSALALITEILSAFHALSRTPVAMAWLVVIGLAFAIGRARLVAGDNSVGGPQQNREPFFQDRITKILFASLLVLGALVGAVALIAPPNTWDAMDYHLPRVVIWISHRSVSFFPTPNYGMLIMAPWAEYAMLQTIVLSGGDRFVNLIEFFSYVGGVIGVSYLAKEFNATARGQLIAAVIAATIPTAVLEASGAMNTGVGAFWIICTMVFLVKWRSQPSYLNTVCLGLAAGLAIFTKGTAFVILPLLVAACWWGWEGKQRVLFLRRSPVILLALATINFAQGVRCYELTGTPIGMPFPAAGTAGLLATSITAKGAVANGFRLTAAHFGTPSDHATKSIEHLFVSAIHALGVDPNDPNAIVPGTTFHIIHFSLLEVLAGNPLHLIVVTVLLLVVIFRWRDFSSEIRWCCVGTLLSAILFITMVRWQPWVNRYELPLFMVAAAIAGIGLDRQRFFSAASVVIAVLLTGGFVYASANRIRSLVPWSRLASIRQSRSLLYFADQHETLASSHMAAAEYFKGLGCKAVGLDCYSDHQEVGTAPKTTFVYPFLALSGVNTGAATVQFVGLDNLTTRYAHPETIAAPSVVVCFGGARIPEKWAQYKNVGGRASVFGDLVIFGPTGELTNSGTVPASLITTPADAAPAEPGAQKI